MCPCLADDSADGVESHRPHGSQVVGMDGQHGLPVVGPAMGGTGVAEAIRVELRWPRVDDAADVVPLRCWGQVESGGVRLWSGSMGLWPGSMESTGQASSILIIT